MTASAVTLESAYIFSSLSDASLPAPQSRPAAGSTHTMKTRNQRKQEYIAKMLDDDFFRGQWDKSSIMKWATEITDPSYGYPLRLKILIPKKKIKIILHPGPPTRIGVYRFKRIQRAVALRLRVGDFVGEPMKVPAKYQCIGPVNNNSRAIKKSRVNKN
jgi:hypothetical protein